MGKVRKFLNKYKVDIALIVIVALLSVAIMDKVAILSVVGTSMEPTYMDGSKVIIKKDNEVDHGQLIIFKADDSWSSHSKPFLKRIIGMPGDKIIIKNGDVAVNGHVKFRNECLSDAIVSLTLNEGEYFVMGDNRMSSNDSLAQLCKGNKVVTVKEDNVIAIGHELFKFGGN